MKVKFFVLFGLFFILTFPAFAVDPECVDVTQAGTIDFSDGNGAICTSATDGNGDPLSESKVLTCTVESKVLTCTVTFVDNAGNVIGTEEVVGGPGEFFTFNTPRDGVGTASAVCVMDELTSETASITAIFPADVAPAQPVILP